MKRTLYMGEYLLQSKNWGKKINVKHALKPEH